MVAFSMRTAVWLVKYWDESKTKQAATMAITPKGIVDQNTLLNAYPYAPRYAFSAACWTSGVAPSTAAKALGTPVAAFTTAGINCSRLALGKPACRAAAMTRLGISTVTTEVRM